MVVGVNYRLGALGWLHRSGIVDAEAGISDMIAALSWVRDHIAGFGGDPANVTVMGQSAGATSIGRLLQAQSDCARANARFGWNTPPFMPVSPVEMTEADMLAQLRAELGPAAIAKRLGIARSSVYRALA